MKKMTRLYVLAFTTLLFAAGALSHPVRADRDDRDRDGWHDHARQAHEWHHRHWHDGHIIYEQNEPYVTYAPPVVVEPPPPVYDEEQPSINFVVPLNIH